VANGPEAQGVPVDPVSSPTFVTPLFCCRHKQFPRYQQARAAASLSFRARNDKWDGFSLTRCKHHWHQAPQRQN
jgi:hypothetical protein